MLITPEEILRAAGLNRKGLRLLGKPLMRWLRVSELNGVYERHRDKEGTDFIDAALQDLGVGYELPLEQLEHIPADRPFILVANHPFGVIDGLIIMRIVAEKRQDFKIMGNFLLERVQPIHQWVVRVNPINVFRQAYGNLSGMRETTRHLSEGKPLIVFPAGTVATYNLRAGRVLDHNWKDPIGKLIQKYGYEVIPLYIHGGNGPAFQILGQLHPVVKLAMQVPITFDHRGKTIPVRIGAPIPPEVLSSFAGPTELNAFLKNETYRLFHNSSK